MEVSWDVVPCQMVTHVGDRQQQQQRLWMYPKPEIKISATRFAFTDELLLNGFEQKVCYSQRRAGSISEFLPEKGSILGDLKYISPAPQNIMACKT